MVFVDTTIYLFLLTNSEAPPLSGPSLTTAASAKERDMVSSLRTVKSHLGREEAPSLSEPATEVQPATMSAQSRTHQADQAITSPSARSDSSSESSSAESEPAARLSKSQAFRQRPRFASKGKARMQQSDEGEDDDEDDEEQPAFLPFTSPSVPPLSNDPSATVRMNTPRTTTQSPSPSQPTRRQRTQTTHSSASSGSSAAAAGTPVDRTHNQRPPGPLSPRRAAELSALSPRRRALAREGSDGTPSMGSSFSDLDGTSCL